MSKIKVSIQNIGGSKKNSAELAMGSVNIVRGSSSSGKSSLMRGIHLAIVGNPIKHADEIENLHLNDRTSDQALLMRGESEGNVMIEYDGQKMNATIPRNGMIKSSNSNEKGVYTTMLSALPPTRLHQAVMNPKSEKPDDFLWVMDELSQAGDYQKLHSVLHPLDNELSSIKQEFEEWKKSRASADSKYDELTARLDEINERSRQRSIGQGKEIDNINKEIQTATTRFEKNRSEFQELGDAIYEIENANEAHIRRIDAAKKQIRAAQIKLDEAEDLQNIPLIKPDMEKLDAAVTAASSKVEVSKGTGNHSPEVMAAIDSYRENSEGINKAYPAHGKNMEQLYSMIGDDTALKAALDEEKEAKSVRDKAVREYVDKRTKLATAESQAAAARADIARARLAKSEAETSMTTAGGSLEKMKLDFSKVERVYKAAEESLADLTKKKLELDSSPEAKEEEEEKEQIQAELKNMDSSKTFEVRFSSLQMLPNQTRRYSEKQAEEIFGGSASGEIRKDFVNRLLDAAIPDIRSRIIDEIDNGFLADVSATSGWTAEEADRQRQETRRIFNTVGTTLFERMEVSPINSVSLDTNYNLRINWADGKTTGLAGAGGERTIIAAALLISMRKAYTPEVPLLMFDGMLENLDPDSMKGLLDFLTDYAKTENIAVVVSLFDSSEAVAKVSVR